jgi:hypothetical protein
MIRGQHGEYLTIRCEELTLEYVHIPRKYVH